MTLYVKPLCFDVINCEVGFTGEAMAIFDCYPLPSYQSTNKNAAERFLLRYTGGHMTKTFLSVVLRSGATALIASYCISALIQSKDGLFKLYITGDSIPLELSESSFHSLRSFLADHTINCR